MCDLFMGQRSQNPFSNINKTAPISIPKPPTKQTAVNHQDYKKKSSTSSDMSLTKMTSSISPTSTHSPTTHFSPFNGSAASFPMPYKSMTSPALPIYKPQEQTHLKPKNVSLVMAVELGKFLEEHNSTDSIILDIRSFSEYSKACIQGAIHVCLPSTLLRRKNFTFEKLIESLPKEIQAQVITRFRNENLRIYLYDNSARQTDTSISQACHGILTKLLNYQPYIQSQSHIKVGILSCGFAQFKDLFPDCIQYPLESSTHNNTPSKQKAVNAVLEQGSFTDSFQSPSIGDNMTLRLNVTDTSTSNASSYLNSPSPQNIQVDSPISSSSPISALLKFQLPSQKVLPPQLFKFPKNEEAMNLESYISAVNINEKQTRISERKKKIYRNSLNLENEKMITHEDTDSLSSFEFPKRSASSGSMASKDDEKYKDKLTVQIKYSKLHSKYSQKNIDENIPAWFQDLMSRTKIQFASQFQKLDILERRRLNSSVSSKDTTSNESSMHISSDELKSVLSPPPRARPHNHSNSSLGSSFVHQNNESETSLPSSLQSHKSSASFSIKSPPIAPYSRSTLFKQGRSHSQPDSLNSLNKPWVRDIDADLTNSEDEDEKIIISSGVELGSKNRYKDIFPYEHTRVKLKKDSISTLVPPPLTHYSNLVNQDIDEAKELNISDSYINANYIDLPVLENSKELLVEAQRAHHTIIPAASEKVRYIATQAPLLSTVHDFYSCIITDRVPLILSLTNQFENGVEKCFQYWKPNNYDGINVKVLEELDVPEMNNNVVIRRIRLTYDNDNKTYDVVQYQIKNWLDLSTLSDPIEVVHSICFKNKLVKQLKDNGFFNAETLPTILVHCSAGCGRTGTWCTIDSILSNLENFDLFQFQLLKSNETATRVYDPVAWTINVFRKQRISMVQNINQFLFIYDCLLYYFTFQIRDNCQKRLNMSSQSLRNIDAEVEKTGVIHRFLKNKTPEIQIFA